MDYFFVAAKVPFTILHVVSVVFGMGAALMSDTLFTFYGKDKKLSPGEIKTLRLLSRLVWWGLVVIAISGVGLFLSDVAKYSQSIKFLAKMTILCVLLLNGYVLHRFIWKHVIKRNFLKDQRENTMRRIDFMCGSISVLSWLSVCTLGVLDHLTLPYTTIILFYGIIIAIGITASQIIERRTFERV